MSAGSQVRGGPSLPPAYAVFSPVLQRLSEPLLQALQGPLEQFERLAPRIGQRRFASHGDFEGLDGLGSRGDVAWMLQSEWLLRTEAPLEFLRRLAEGETLHHDRRYADPGASLVYRAMVSIGPGSLGHGRVLILASLFFLARVAQARGAAFHWCCLPGDEGAVWWDELSVNTVKRMLKAASYREMDAADMAQAARLWTESFGKPAGKPVDWRVRGVARIPPPPGQGLPPAPEMDGATLSFRLDPPRRGQSRTAEARLVEGGATVARLPLAFPDDRVCVSALRSPFRPLAPPRAGPEAADRPTASPEPIGWAPRDFVSIGSRAMVVRMAESLLILLFDSQGHIQSRFVARLPGSLTLAGLRLRTAQLSVLLYAGPGSRRLTFVMANLLDARVPFFVRRTPPMVADQLFRKQGARAIPLLTAGRASTFYSASGAAFDLGFGVPGEPMTFSPRYQSPRILWASGAHQIVHDASESKAAMRVVKAGGGHTASYDIEPRIEPGRLFGALYSHPGRSLAYSTTPGNWTVKSRASDQGDTEAVVAHLRLHAHERPLAMQANAHGLRAKVWSDARIGGDGFFWTLRQQGGELVREKVFRLGADALDVLKVEICDNGIWALLEDETGEAAELRWYRSRSSPCRRIDLAEQVRMAKPLDLEALGG